MSQILSPNWILQSPKSVVLHDLHGIALLNRFINEISYSIFFIVSYAFQEFEMLTLFLSRAISNRARERSCQDCLTFTETLSSGSFQ